jgi:hypothetical protein
MWSEFKTARRENRLHTTHVFYCLCRQLHQCPPHGIKFEIKVICLNEVGCETWSLTLREEHRLRVFENRALRRIFGPKRDEVTEGWRKLHNEELHGLYSSPGIVRVTRARRMRWARHVARMGEVRGAYNILVGRPEGRRPLGRT